MNADELCHLVARPGDLDSPPPSKMNIASKGFDAFLSQLPDYDRAHEPLRAMYEMHNTAQVNGNYYTVFACADRAYKSGEIGIVDRFVDYMDLATTCCVITYTNVAANISRIYHVPFYDIYTYATEQKMLLPWCLDANVAKTPGTIEFFIQFFKTGEEIDLKNNVKNIVLQYNLNTCTAKSKVLSGMTMKSMEEDYILNANQFEILSEAINNVAQYRQTYWTIID